MKHGEHSLPPLAHEVMRTFLPGAGKLITEAVRELRSRPGWDETTTLSPVDIAKIDPLRSYVERFCAQAYLDGDTAETAADNAGFAAIHVYYMFNHELHRSKVFWVDASLAWMLMQTRLDIEGELLNLPFPAFCIAFTDRTTLEFGEKLLLQDRTSHIRGDPLKIICAYVVRLPESTGISINVNLLLDSRTGKWPYLLCRDLYFGPKDRMETILESQHPEVAADERHRFFFSPETKTLVHLVLNAILYATSLPHDWAALAPPVERIRKAARMRGKKRQLRAESRVRELMSQHSSERVYHLPGKIPISQIRQMEELQKTESGRKLMARFMVRGHWHRAAPSWKDQRPRWIEPYWKGPEMAAVIERQYRMKT